MHEDLLAAIAKLDPHEKDLLVKCKVCGAAEGEECKETRKDRVRAKRRNSRMRSERAGRMHVPLPKTGPGLALLTLEDAYSGFSKGFDERYGFARHWILRLEVGLPASKKHSPSKQNFPIASAPFVCT